MIRFLTCVTCWALVALCGCTRGRQEGFTLWQLPSQADDHGNSYVIRTPSGRVVAIDGGKAAEADYLRGFLAALGNEVDAWIVTHPHFDHVGAMNELLRNRRGLRVHRVYESRFTPRMIDAEAALRRACGTSMRCWTARRISRRSSAGPATSSRSTASASAFCRRSAPKSH